MYLDITDVLRKGQSKFYNFEIIAGAVHTDCLSLGVPGVAEVLKDREYMLVIG